MSVNNDLKTRIAIPIAQARLGEQYYKSKDYSKAVYIGDGKSDGTGAITVGIVFLAVTYGFGFKTIEEAQKFDPIGVADSCTGIREIILGQN